MIFIFSYNRKEMLESLIEELMPFNEYIMVIDDGSDFDINDERVGVCKFPHGGKSMWWHTWNEALKIAQSSIDNKFMFLPDDISNLDVKKIKRIRASFSIKERYAYNILNVGNDRGWTRLKRKDCMIAGYESEVSPYVDCGYMTNRETLEVLDWNQDWINPIRFDREGISSGVGEAQSRAYWLAGVPMYLPKIKLAHHGNHESKMHPIERKKNPLVTY